MIKLPKFTQSQEISALFREVGQKWAASSDRPRIPCEVSKHWNGLVDEWAESDLPLFIRKASGVRGQEVHHSHGRRIIVADNSPAQWSFLQAFLGSRFSLGGIKSIIEQDQIPIAFAAKSSEKTQMNYKRTLTTAESLGSRKWKLCHIESIGLNTKQAIVEIPLDILKKHFQQFLKPSNHFLVPLHWAGMGELIEVREEIGKYERLE
jgi:hypothetical protein